MKRMGGKYGNIAFLICIASLAFFLGCKGPGSESSSEGFLTVNITTGHGRVIPDGLSGPEGLEVILRVIPDPGYQLKSGTLKYGELPIDTATRRITLVRGTFPITAEFEPFTPNPQPERRPVTMIDSGFNMVKVPIPPEGINFPIGINDTFPNEVSNPYPVKIVFWIGETEVTWKQWRTIKNWAESNGYTFANPGQGGSNGAGGDQAPVTNISWYDAVVWCNALTEWYNAAINPSPRLRPVYYRDVSAEASSIPLRNSNKDQFDEEVLPVSSPPGSANKVVYRDLDGNGLLLSNGFRLPANREWGLAARWQGRNPAFFEAIPIENNINGLTYYFTPGIYASGATADYTDQTVNNMVAWYERSSTQDVGLTVPNMLGLYDMSGNVWEWCQDAGGPYHAAMGGSWNDEHPYLRIGERSNYPKFANDAIPYPVSPPRDVYNQAGHSNTVGFRFARNDGNW
jgi:formylglycine-generating enzyme required for sulfatase activity